MEGEIFLYNEYRHGIKILSTRLRGREWRGEKKGRSQGQQEKFQREGFEGVQGRCKREESLCFQFWTIICWSLLDNSQRWWQGGAKREPVRE